jgi:hypothetical protein
VFGCIIGLPVLVPAYPGILSVDTSSRWHVGDPYLKFNEAED